MWPPSQSEDFFPSSFGIGWQFGEEILAKGEDLGIVLNKQSLLDDGTVAGQDARDSLTLLITSKCTSRSRSAFFPFSSHVDDKEGC